MLNYNKCDIKNKEYDSNCKFSICSQLSVVDDTKSDMEYNCFQCTTNK